MGAALTQAQSWLGKRRDDLAAIDRDFIDQSVKRDSKARAWARQVQTLIYVLLVGIIAGLVGWINQSYLKEQLNWYTTVRPYIQQQVRPYVLTAAAERALKPGDSFKECAKDCPEMVVVPAGDFMMGSPADEEDRYDNEDPQHKVVLAEPFAVSKFEVTFEQWDACVAVGACAHVPDSNMGRGTQPVINVSWDDVQQYVAWFSKMTGRPYRLLSEAEWEYAARAGTTTAYSWGDEIGKEQCQLQRLRQRVGQPANRSGWLVCAQPVRPLRYARQRLGVGRGLFARQLRRGTQGRLVLDRTRRLQKPCPSRRFLGQLSSGPPLGPPLLVLRRRSWHRSWLPCRADAWPLVYRFALGARRSRVEISRLSRPRPSALPILPREPVGSAAEARGSRGPCHQGHAAGFSDPGLMPAGWIRIVSAHRPAVMRRCCIIWRSLHRTDATGTRAYRHAHAERFVLGLALMGAACTTTARATTC